MKTLRYSYIILLLCCLCFHTSMRGQDARNRVTSTIIADGLAQLPAQSSAVYNEVMDEMARTGEEGIASLVGMLSPSGKGNNAPFEYAISSVTDYVTHPDKVALRDGVKQGLVKGLASCKDNANKAFLLAQIQKVATATDIKLFMGYLDDSYLQSHALEGLALIPGVDAQQILKMGGMKVSKTGIAHLISMRKMADNSLEEMLLAWIPGADAATLKGIYDALTYCGTEKSMKVLAVAAQKAGFKYEATHATDAYLRLLNRLVASNSKAVMKASKQLIAQGDRAVRCGGLELLLQSAGTKGAAEVLKALKDNDIQYRNTALKLAQSCAGDDIYASVLRNFGKLSLAAQCDVVRWLGNNYVSSAVETVANAMNSADETLAKAAIQAAGKIGGNRALASLCGQLGGKYAKETMDALLAFNGKVDAAVVGLLADTNPSTLTHALRIVSNRHLYSAYDAVLRLLDSQNDEVKQAAYGALAGITRPSEFTQLCDMLEKADAAAAPKLQKALLFALHTLSPEQQFAQVSGRMAGSKRPQLYYPLLSQAGNKEALQLLQSEYAKPSTQADAFAALLKVKNPEAVSTLYTIAATDEKRKDAALMSMLSLLKASPKNAMSRFLDYTKALSLNPSAAVKNSFIGAIGTIYELPALSWAAHYLSDKATSFAAATAVKNIIAKNKGLQKGAMTRGWLEKAQQVFAAKTHDADAGYAVDEIKGILAKFGTDGFAPAMNDGKARRGLSLNTKKSYENFELYAEWRANEVSELWLRSMPAIRLTPSGEVEILTSGSKTVSGKQGVVPAEWNVLYVKLVNDRLMVVSNGVVINDNAIFAPKDGKNAANISGLIKFISDGDGIDVCNCYVNELPSTPVFTLSKEEKAQGFEVLFDGRSLDKWQGNFDNYVPEDGSIYVKAHFGVGGNLYSKKTYSDFVYRFEFCFVNPGVNNGIGIRTKLNTNAAYEGMEIQVLDHDDPIYKGLRDYQQHGSVYGIIVPKHVKFGKLGTWNTEEIRAVGDRITVTVNGEVILDGNIREACQGHHIAPDGGKSNPYTIDHNNHPGLFNKEGHISFCGHGEGVKFRNLRILDLSKKKVRK